ncbi:MAG: HAMP domain-containing histidine kinase [Verrucomicrobiae bacterium]|nr:HAMP domain-containing histidine kinase [Verrucomicrobiae bacterium]
MPSFRSLKSRIAWATCLALFVVLGLGGIVIHSVVTRRLRNQFDHGLADKLRYFEATCFVKSSTGIVALGMLNDDWEALQDPADPDYFQFDHANGKSIYQSRNLLGKGLHSLAPLPSAVGETTHGFVDLPGGRTGRFTATLFYPPIKDRGQLSGEKSSTLVRVTVAHDATMLTAASSELGTVLGVVGCVMGLVILGVAWVATRTGLRPLDALGAQIDATSVGEFEKFTIDRLPNELVPVVTRLNALMERSGTTLRHEREFTSNVAHELRTPLAVMRTQLESILRNDNLPFASEEKVREALGTEGELERAVENLLWLARLDRGLDNFQSETVEVGRFMRKCWTPFLDAADAKGLQVEWNLRKAPTLACSPDLLRILLRNLYENAVAYTPSSGRVSITGTNSGEPPSICVTNTCSGMRKQDLDALFARADRRPSMENVDTGLVQPARLGIGLALSRRVASILGGELTASLTATNQVEFRLQLTQNQPFNN